ncbi:MAG TPA: hypothetical protein VHM25_15425 [Polyangiaceae bacterium]|nr:hypothetical protein [Polyangiaceae bacterium]
MPRFHNALLGALALHGSLWLVHSRHDVASAPRAPERAAEQFIDIDELPLADAPLAAPLANEPATTPSTGSDASSGRPSAHPAADSRHASSSNLPTLADAPSSADALAANAAAATPEEPTPAEPERKIDLGLDGHFFLGVPSERPPSVRKPESKPRPDTQKRLENALAADDVQRGLARGNALVGSLGAAAREAGPLRGEAVFAVTVGADGGMLSAELVRGASSDWAAALGSFRALAAKKRLRVPPGARGLRVTFSVKAKVQRPSGKEVEASAISAAPPAFAPNGLVPHGDFDLADLAGGAQRLVYARVLSEEVL